MICFVPCRASSSLPLVRFGTGRQTENKKRQTMVTMAMAIKSRDDRRRRRRRRRA